MRERKRDWLGQIIDAAAGRGRNREQGGAIRQRGAILKRPSQGWHTFDIQKAYCTPARGVILQALNPYGVPCQIGEERVVVKDKSNQKLRRIERAEFLAGREIGIAQACAAEVMVKVPAQQARWAEYLMERTQRLVVVRGGIDSRNRGWADQHTGVMPRPWIEEGCKIGSKT